MRAKISYSVLNVSMKTKGILPFLILFSMKHMICLILCGWKKWSNMYYCYFLLKQQRHKHC